MILCCFKRKKFEKEKIDKFKKIYLKKSKETLIQKKEKYENRMCSDLILSYLHGGVIIGSCIATKVSVGATAPVTVPAAALSTYSSISSYNSYKNYKLKYMIINDILKKYET